MTTISIAVEEIGITAGGLSGLWDEGELEVYSAIFGDDPHLCVTVNDINGEHAADFVIKRIANIDALGRFCAMTVEHFRRVELDGQAHLPATKTEKVEL